MSPVELLSPAPDPGIAQVSMEPQAAILATALATHIEMGMAMSERSQQTEVGASQIGAVCPRQLAYRAQKYPVFNYTDCMKLLMGIGIHHALAQIFERLNRITDRYLVEYSITHAGTPGQLDLYDKATATVIDWKTTSKTRLNKYAKDGPPAHYIHQLQIYAAGLTNAGWPVKRIAIAFLPYDGTLSAMWVWLGTPDLQAANDVVDRFLAVADKDVREVPAVASRSCGYCDYYSPTATDLRLGCPGA